MSGKMVEFKANGGTCEGYLALPESGKGPGVIVLQEWWGLVDHIKDVARRFADAGFVALAPDLYHGESASHPDDAGRMMMALNIAKSEKDLSGAVAYLLSLEEVVGDKVGTVGFCMGGQLSLFAACTNDKVGACVDYYGIHPEVKPDFGNLKAPVLGFFAEKDEFVTLDSAKTLEQSLKDAGAQTDFHYFDGVGHAFFNDSRPEAYNQAAANDSWQKMTAFFKANL